MNTLSSKQIDTISEYWTQRKGLEKEKCHLFMNLEVFQGKLYNAIGNCSCDQCEDEDNPLIETTRRMIEDLWSEIKEIDEKIELLDKEYETTLASYGLELCDRDMDEELFAFINDGDLFYN